MDPHQKIQSVLRLARKKCKAEVSLFVPDSEFSPLILCDDEYDKAAFAQKEFIEALKGREILLLSKPHDKIVPAENYTWSKAFPQLKHTSFRKLASRTGEMSGLLVMLSTQKIRNTTGPFSGTLYDVSSSQFPAPESANFQYYRSIFNNSSDLIAVIGFDGLIKSVNPAFRRTLLWGEKELLSQAVWNLIHPQDLPEVEKGIKKLSNQKKTFSFKARFRNKKADYLWLEWHIKVDFAGRLVYATGRDLTTIEKAKSELQLAKTMLEETNRVALIGGWELNTLTNEISWTSITREIHEVGDEFEVSLENAILFYREGENRRVIEHLVHNAIHFNRPYDVELEIITAKNTRKWIRTKGQPVLEGRKCVRLIGTVQDIDKEKKNQFHLERINTHLQAIMEASTEAAIIALDITGTIMYFNSGAEMLLGYAANEIVGKKTPVFFHEQKDLEGKAERLSTEYSEQVNPDIECLIYKARRGDTDTQEYTYICRDNSRVEVETSITPIRNNHNVVIGFVLIGLDVSEKKERERQLIDSENRFRIFFENSHVVLYTHDLNGNFLSMNPRGTNLLGYSQEEIINRNILDIVPLESQKSLPEYLQELSEKGFSKGLMQIVDKNHNRVTWMYHNILAQDTDGTRYVIGNVVDITDRVELENSLKLAKQTAEQNARMKEMFLANMSHEIRTPMNAITGFGRLLGESGDLTQEQKEYVNAINIASSNLLNLINDILDFSKIESGQIRLENIPFSLKAQINYVWKILAPNAQQKGLQFKCLIDHGMPDSVLGDPTRLSQVLVNLINNAIKFTEKGYIRLFVQLVSQENNRYFIEFEVEDTGIGIPAEKTAAIFDRFTQANTNTTRKYGGTGLGLSISKSLIELQGGNIRVESQEGSGSRFIFQLPFELAGEEIGTHENETDHEEEVRSKNNILLVEDNVLNQQLAKKVLELRGYQVDLAENGLMAIERLKIRNYDLILMDLQMPEMDGYQTSQHIRNEMKLSTPIMAMTAHSLVGEKEKCLKVGMNDYITKPFDPKMLFSKIKEHTENSPEDIPEALVPEKQTDESEVLDLSYLRMLTDNNKEFEKEILETSLKTIPHDLGLLHESINLLDYSRVRAIAHKLKSSFMTIGMDAREILQRLEFENITDFETLESLFYALQNKYSRTRKAVEMELSTNY